MAENTWLRGRFPWVLGLSLALHLLLTPVASLLGLISLLGPAPPAPSLDEEIFEEIPIELFEGPLERATTLPDEDPVELVEQLFEPEPDAISARETPKAEAPAERPRTSPAPSSPEPKREPPPAASSTVPPAPSATAPPPSATAPPSPPAKAGPEEKRSQVNPIALRGKTAKAVDQKAYVGLVVYMDRVRSHPAGKKIGALLPQLPQWRDFFRASGLDPVQDFERLHVVGPSFTNSSQVIAQLEYRTSTERVVSAVDQLVRRSGGRWVSRAPPVARAYADRAERSFIVRAPNAVVVAPPKLEERLLAAGRPEIAEPESDEAVVARIEKPHAPFARLGVMLPQSLESITLWLYPRAQGAVEIYAEGRDHSAAEAREHAFGLEQQLNGALAVVSNLSSFFGRIGFGGGVTFPQIKLSAKGRVIQGRVRLDAGQVDFVLARLERQLTLRARALDARAAAASAASARAPTQLEAAGGGAARGTPTQPEAAPTPRAKTRQDPPPSSSGGPGPASPPAP